MRALPRKSAIPESVSLNFSVAKVVAIFVVVAGHWFAGTILWVPVTIGLFIFAFSSAYFTSTIYGENVDTRVFWQQKLRRLGIGYWITLAFLVPVVLLKGGTVMHWHSLVHFVGMSGLLNWFAIQNRSSLGAGLWFFTLLLIFYAIYPYLAKISSSKRGAFFLAITAALLAICLEETVKVGHELWLTTLGFILGTVFGLNQFRVSARSTLIGMALSCGLLLGANAAGFKEANTLLICLSGISVSLWLTKAALPNIKPFMLVAKLEKYLLEIFLIHTYLFIRVTTNTYIDFILSLTLIIVIAVILRTIIEAVLNRFFAKQTRTALAGRA